LTEQAPLAPPGIFKAYDIRGLYGEEMDETTAYAVARAFVRVLGRLREKDPSDLRIGLGRDMRLTAPAMAKAFREGLIDESAGFLDAGMVATEMLYFLVGSRELDGGAMITASHNPKAYTGIKLVREGALALSGDAGIGDVRREIEGGIGPPRTPGTFSEEVDVWDDFHRHVLSFIDPEAVRPLKVVVDGGNGMGGPMVGPVLEKLGLDLEEMYFEPNGEFPDHEPNPLLSENRKMMRAAPTWGLPGTATPTVASSSTATGSSATATSSAPFSPGRRSPRTRGRRSSTTRARAAPFPTS
jgi:phosphomannomutase